MKSKTAEYIQTVLDYGYNSDVLQNEITDKIYSDTKENVKLYMNEKTNKLSFNSGKRSLFSWRGEKEYIYDVNNNKYIDLIGGDGTFLLGHANKEITKYISDQYSKIGLHSQKLIEPMIAYLAKAVAIITPGDIQYSFFTNSGAEAVEMALKLARLNNEGKWYISARNSYHGKSNGALSVSGNGESRKPFLSMLQPVYQVEYGDAYAVKTAIKNIKASGESVAAVIVEPIQGRAGVIVPPKGYLKELRQICDETGVILIVDEIETGMGRTGTMWCCEKEDVVPDIIIFGGAFGGGTVPITGIAVRPDLWNEKIKSNPNMLGSPTFGGNPISCTAALATIRYILKYNIADVCRQKGRKFMTCFTELKDKFGETLVDFRGEGLMLAIEFVNADVAAYTVEKLLENNILVSQSSEGSAIIRITPSALISDENIKIVSDSFYKIVEAANSFR